MTLLDLQPEWWQQAACSGKPTELFFDSVLGAGAEVCRGCEVRVECLAWCFAAPNAYSTRYGVFGGTFPEERKNPVKAYILARAGRPEWRGERATHRGGRPGTHGGEARYQQGCRCEFCVEGHAKRNAKDAARVYEARHLRSVS